MKAALLSSVLLLTATAAFADVIHLNDGTRLDGDVRKSGDDAWVVTTAPGQTTRVAVGDVKRIELTAENADPTNADARLYSLRRSAEFSTDLDDVIARYERFIEQNVGLRAAAEAVKDLAEWRDRRDRKLVKHGVHWVTPDERAELQVKEIAAIDDARRLIREGRAADAVVQRVLAENPQSAAALYLRGLLAYQRDEFAPARKAFESVNALTANHAPTLNNLGVILSRQNQHVGSLNFYDQAMQSAGSGGAQPDQVVINNVAEALHALPANLRDNAVVKRVQRRFTAADEALRARMEKKGLHRWGSQWVDDVELARLEQAERDVRDQLDDLADRFSAIEMRIGQIEDDIDTNSRLMRQIAARSYARDPYGRVVRTALPSTYYDLAEDNANLQSDRDRQARKLSDLRAQAKALQKNLPTPQFTGLQQMIGVEGTPTPAVTPPTTQPAPR